jgi:hypothetical protein
MDRQHSLKITRKKQPKDNKYDNAGVYKLKYKKCEQYYIGETGRKFKTRYKERIRDIKNNKDNIGYVAHILNTGHSYGTIESKWKL